jgi:adenosylhomocysteinase
MDGFRVMPIREAVRIADLIVTATGNINVISRGHFVLMKDGVILANAGHFNVEVDIAALGKICRSRRQVKPLVTEYTLRNKKRVYVLAEGRLVNLSCAEGHPAEVMDMSFSNQALSCEYIRRHRHKLEKKVYPVPEAVDRKVARLKLRSMGIRIDGLTRQQEKYLSSWEEGT